MKIRTSNFLVSLYHRVLAPILCLELGAVACAVFIDRPRCFEGGWSVFWGLLHVFSSAFIDFLFQSALLYALFAPVQVLYCTLWREARLYFTSCLWIASVKRPRSSRLRHVYRSSTLRVNLSLTIQRTGVVNQACFSWPNSLDNIET